METRRTYVRVGTRSVDGKHTDVINSQSPNSKGPTKRCSMWVTSFQHSVRSKCVFLLSNSLFLDGGDSGGEVLFVDGLALTLARIDFFLKLLMLVRKPLGNLRAAERKLSRPIFKVEKSDRVLGGNLSGYSQRSTTRCRNRPPGFVAG